MRVLNVFAARTTGIEGVLGTIEATSVCRKMNVSSTVRAIFSLVSDSVGMKTEAIPVKVTSSAGTIRL